MTRLEKKCLIAASGSHALLFVILLVGPAFFVAHDKIQSHQLITVISGKVVDDAMSSGAHSTVTTQQQPPPPAPQQKDPVSEPVHQEPVHIENPVKLPTKPEKTEEPTPVKVRPQHHLDPSDLALVKKPVKRTPTPKETDDSAAREAAAQKEAAERRVAALKQAIRGLGSNMGKAVAIDSPQGNGGEAMTNYRDIVASKYTLAWSPPANLEDDAATVEVVVTIARSGKVIDSRITRHSANPTMNKSIQNLLDNVTFIEPFPESSKDQQRNFPLRFNLKDKRSIG